MLTCLTRAWRRGSSDKLIAELLSHKIVVAPSLEKPSADSNILSQMHSCAASNAAMYSASQEEAATVFCFLVDHNTSPEPNDHA